MDESLPSKAVISKKSPDTSVGHESRSASATKESLRESVDQQTTQNGSELEKDEYEDSSSNREIESAKPSRPPLWRSKRLGVAFACSFGLFTLMVLRFNLSVALVCMIDGLNSTSSEKEAEFHHWDASIRSAVLGSFFYGYLATQLIGGWMADRFSPKLGISLGVGSLSLCALASPAMARLHYTGLIVVRIIQGLVSGLAFPSFFGLISVWSSQHERATLMSITYLGISVASIVNYPLSSQLCLINIDNGWPMVFYVPGTFGIIWTIFFHFATHSHPESDPTITMEEKSYLEKTAVKKKSVAFKDVPWLGMLTSVPLHGLWITHICSAWGFYLVTVNFPQFLSQAMGLPIAQLGWANSYPFMGMFIFSWTGIYFDYLKEKGVMSFLNLRRLFNSIGFAVPCACMFLIGALPYDDWISHMAIITVSVSIHQFALCGGFYFSHGDIAGPFKSIAFAVTNTMAQIPGFLIPIVIAELTPSKEKAKMLSLKDVREDWLAIFYISASIQLFGGVAYFFLVTDQLESWARPSRHEDEYHDEINTPLAVMKDSTRDS